MVYESSADAAWKAAALCLGTVPVVGYIIKWGYFVACIEEISVEDIA